MNRGLSRILYIYNNEPVCIEDLPSDERLKRIAELSPEAKDAMIISLCYTIKELGDKFNIKNN